MVDPDIATACPKPDPLSPVNVTILFWQEEKEEDEDEDDDDEDVDEDDEEYSLLQL